MQRRAMKNMIALAGFMLVLAALPARAQDVPGIEICTHESQLDRRTGCLQSNVEFLHQVVAKNALDAQQKLNAASRDIAALKDQLAAATRDLPALKDQLAAATRDLPALKEQLAAAIRELAALRDSLSGMKARLDQLAKGNPPR